MSGFLNGIKSFVHSISTSDHYASYDASRTAGQEDAAPLNSAAVRASSPGLNYQPGLRSSQLSLANSSEGTRSEIALNDLGPIPAPELSWARIDSWVEQNYPELSEQLMYGATANDIADLEHDLDCVLPPDVRESLAVHDGQERGGRPTGLLFGITLLDMESISEEWNVWRRTALRVAELSHKSQKSAAGPSLAPKKPGLQRTAWVDKQASCPPGAVQPVYAHTAWIPLAKDFDGNNIGVDLAPGPAGRYGQVIMFGREFDTKYVVAPSWGDFLAQFAADLESGQSYIDDDIENAVFAFKSPTGQLVSYFSVLRHRVERTLPKQEKPKQKSAHNHANHPNHLNHSASHANHGASVSHAPVNSGRPTQRLGSPTGSSTSLVSRKQRPPSNLASQVSEVDLNETSKNDAEPKEAASPKDVETDTAQNGTDKVEPSAVETDKPAETNAAKENAEARENAEAAKETTTSDAAKDNLGPSEEAQAQEKLEETQD